MTFTGDKEMKENLERLVREFPLLVRRGTREWAQEFLSQVIPGVPFKTGRLAGSGRVRIAIKKTAGKENVSASVVFGGDGILYARKVHELNKKHPEHEKYLERPLLQKVSTAGAEIREKIDLQHGAAWLKAARKAARS
jgi:hypothetical protein